MEKLYYPQIDETLYKEVLPNGLTVMVVPRPGFTKKLAYFITDFGSIHTKFNLDGKDITVPDGIAHFLEHKMFDLPGRDVTTEFAALGARPNAFTSYDVTAYYFSCTESFDESLKLLLEFVSTPYFTEESVEKEQGIIGQEIGMHEDNPGSRSFELLMEAMYENHPIRTPILGTKETIGRITVEDLHACHKAFYRPGNMLLCVMGDVDPQKVCAIAADTLPEQDTVTVTRVDSWEEKLSPLKTDTRSKMEVAMPMFQLGFKCAPLGNGYEAILQEAIGDLAAEALFGESSPLYMRLYEEGIIDGSFGGGFETVDGMSLLIAGGDSDDPEAVREAILEEAKVLAETGIQEENFLRMKRSAMGRRIRDLDSFDTVCFRLCAYHFSKYDYFLFPEIYRNIQKSDIQSFIQRVVTPANCSLCVIDPTQEEA